MNPKRGLFIGILVISGFLTGIFSAAVHPTPDVADVVTLDAGLWQQNTEMVSIIVTGADAANAARAVQNVGGQVLGHLMADRAVLATVPVAQLDALAIESGIRSITRSDQPSFVGEPIIDHPGS